MHKGLMSAVAIASMLMVAYFIYANRRQPCDGIFEQTAPQLKVKLDFIGSHGEWTAGPGSVQDVAKESQNVALHLKTCCISRQDGLMTQEQYDSCLKDTKNYEASIVQVSKAIEEAQAAKREGQSELLAEKVKEAKGALEASAKIAAGLAKLAGNVSAQASPQQNGIRPWEQASAVIKLKSGRSVRVDASSVRWGCCSDSLTLDYGQSIPFKNMRAFSILDDQLTIEILPLQGEPVKGVLASESSIEATNELGPYSSAMRSIDRVDFIR